MQFKVSIYKWINRLYFNRKCYSIESKLLLFKLKSSSSNVTPKNHPLFGGWFFGKKLVSYFFKLSPHPH